jgi:ArsR family transcriptional regulator
MDECNLACCELADGEPLDPAAAEDLSVGFKALGDSHRVAVVDLLLRAGEPVCVVDIERHLPLAQSTVSYHLKFLADAGVLDRERKGRWMYYTVKSDRLEDLHEALGRWLDPTRARSR